MSYRLEDIVHEQGSHWVLKVPKGFEVCRIGVTHSTRVAFIGEGPSLGLPRAIEEVERREAQQARQA